MHITPLFHVITKEVSGVEREIEIKERWEIPENGWERVKGKLQSGFRWEFQVAIREKNKGRGSGGDSYQQLRKGTNKDG